MATEINFRPRDQISVVFCQIRQGLSKLTKTTGFYVTYFPSGSRVRINDSTSPALTRQDHSTSSGLQGATAGTNGSSTMRRTDTPVDEAIAEPDATGAISDRDDAGVRTSTGAGTVDQERSEGRSADAISEGAANTVTTSTGAHSSSNDPSAAPVGGVLGTCNWSDFDHDIGGGADFKINKVNVNNNNNNNHHHRTSSSKMEDIRQILLRNPELPHEEELHYLY